MTNYDKAYNDIVLNNVISKLSEKIAFNCDVEVTDYDLRRTIWLTSVLSESKIVEHKKKAQKSAILINNVYSDDSIDICCRVALSRLGNALASNKMGGVNSNYYNDELELIKSLSTVELNENDVLTTSFQGELIRKLKSNSNIAISAPTSSGKSFIINEYLKEKINNVKGSVLYLVPTKALISQVAEDLLDEGLSVSIKTSLVDESYNEKTMFVLTPERAIKILNNETDVNISLMFIDEIQNIEDFSSRGFIFQHVISSVIKKWPEAKLIVAGPFINKANRTIPILFNVDSDSCYSPESPVSQIFISALFDDYDCSINILSDQGETESSLKFEDDFRKWNISRKIRFIIESLVSGEQNLIYCKDPSVSEKYAKELSKSPCFDDVRDDRIKELVEFIKEEIHPRYNLVNILSKGVAYHHSKLPDLIRKELEDLFKLGALKNIFCTSTLLQGVNISANNIIISSPYKRSEKLSKFEFYNLIGRAGRINKYLFGKVICIENFGKKWSCDYFESNPNIEIESPISLAFKTISLEHIIAELTSQDFECKSNNQGLKNLVSYMRHNVDKSELYLYKVISGAIGDNDTKRVLSLTKQSIATLVVPKSILAKNPSIDPLLQNVLFKKISNNIEIWVIHSNSNYNKSFLSSEAEGLPHECKPFYWQLAGICEGLDEIFNLRSEAYFSHNIKISPKAMAYKSLKWMDGASLKKIINSEIRFRNEKIKDINITNDEDINNVIKSVIDINTKIVTHLLPKYFKLLSDCLDFLLDDEGKEKYKLTLSLPVFLELGSKNKDAIALISTGLNRTISIDIARVYGRKERNIDIVEWSKKDVNIRSLKPIFKRYLKQIKWI